MKANIVGSKSMAFAVRIVNLYKYLTTRRRELVLSKQVLKSGTSIGANIREANSAQSKSDFVAKLAIALKECDETGYWLELLFRTEYVSERQYKSLESDRGEIFALLTSIIKTSRMSLRKH
jgi:four helix bundle protein